MTPLPPMNKILVDQATDRVIWLAPGPFSVVPILDPTLNYRTPLGTIAQNLYQEYNQFRLFYDVNSQSLKASDLPFETAAEKEKAVLLRYKCQIFGLLNSAFNVYAERMNLPSSKHLELVNDQTRDDWIEVYQESYECSKDSATKLLDFKLTEYKSSSFLIESARMKMIAGITKAKTLQELKFVFDTTNIKVFNYNPIKIF